MEYKTLTTEQLLSYFTGTIFQTFYDPDSTQEKAPWFTQHDAAKLKDLNEKRYGIYFSVNGFKNRRITEEVTKLNALYGDLDVNKEGSDLTPEDVLTKKRNLFKALIALPIKPNIIITTKNGLQPLFLMEDPGIETSTIESYKNCLQGLTAWSVTQGCKGDDLKDIARVMRLPGYYHHKSEPFMVKAFLIHEKKTTLRNLILQFPFFDEEKMKNDYASKDGQSSVLDTISIEDIALSALAEYGEPNAYFDKTGRIWLARGVTGAFKGKRDNCDFIASNSHELPYGNKITFVQKLLKLTDNKEAFKWIAKKFNLKTEAPQAAPLNIPQPRSMSEVARERIEERKLEKLAPSTGYPELDKLIGGWIPGHLITLTGDTNVGKTAAACNFAERLRRQNRKTLYFSLEPENSLADYLASVRLNKKYSEVSDLDLNFDDGNIKLYGKEEIKKIEDLVAAMEQLDGRYDLAVIDHIGFFVTDNRNWIQEQGQILKKLAGLTKKLHMTILVIAHLRKPERTKKPQNWTPTHDDISGSAAFKQDSQDLLILTRTFIDPENYLIGNSGKLYVTKAKAGTSGAFDLIFSEKSAYITTLEEVMTQRYGTPTQPTPNEPKTDTELEKEIDAIKALEPLPEGTIADQKLDAEVNDIIYGTEFNDEP